MKFKVDNKVLMTGLIVLGVVIVTFGVIGFFESAAGYNTITAYGDGSVEVMPDFVSVYFNVQTQANTAAKASSENSDIVSAMKSSLIALGFFEDEIKTESFSVYPNYDWESGKQEITGYTATHAIKVKMDVSEKDKAGDVIDAGVSAGAGINYIGYELTKENENKYKAEAIEAATADAKVKAEALASGAGRKLGKIVSISTNDGYYGGPWVAYSASEDFGSSRSGAEIATEINPSDQEITARVTVSYEIK